MIILEGPDGSGKTTLLEKLKNIGFEELKPVPRGSICEKSRWENLLKRFGSYDVVMDRCFISEWIYRCVKCDLKSNFNLTDFSSLMEQNNITYVFCKNKKSYENAMNRGEDYVTDKNEHDKLSLVYDFICNTVKIFTKAKVIEYDYQTNDVNYVLEKYYD